MPEKLSSHNHEYVQTATTVLSATSYFAYNYSIQKCSVYHASYFTPYTQSILFYITYRPQACLYEWLLHDADETLNRGSPCWTRFWFKGSSKCFVQRNEYKLLAALYRASSILCSSLHIIMHPKSSCSIPLTAPHPLHTNASCTMQMRL